jgi:hypothetical protein
VIRLLEEPALLQQELDRRLVAARASDPTRKREQSLQRELTHVGKGIERLLNAYQEGLLSIEQLRERMPVLRQRQQTLRAELQAIADQTNDRAAFLRLAETLTAFLARLRSAAETLSVIERQRIVRLLVKDVLVGEDTITIRHSIPIPSGPPQNGGSQSPDGQHYLLCKGRGRANVVELVADGPGGHFEGLNLRLYNPESHQWSVNFANSNSGMLSQPTIGKFKNGRGEFFDQETVNGRAIFVRFVISDITPDSCRFEQAFSEDGGKTWEVNWIATDRRVKDESDETR